MRRAILAAATVMIALFHASPGVGQQFNPEQCAAIGPASERLDCYDSIFRSGRFSGGNEEGNPEMGLWASGVEVSQIEGTERPFASLESEQLIPAQPRGRAPARLTILCQDEQPVVQFSFAGQFMGTETSRSGLITIQFDRQPPRSQSLDLSGDRTALGFFSEDDARAFIDRLLVTNRLIVRAQPQGERSVTVSFQIEGIEQALQPVREACGW
ncbi:type VI secretion system-associated protein TagO [Pelagibacterium halotolerans]|uniref:type VI secretion system-associated protein TagO n=1 Tax=Pelagibacterium halotolerans TaxID=531813 RepID=UPI00384F6C35